MLVAGAGSAHGQAPAEIARIDLARPFATTSPWTVAATQGPPADLLGTGDEPGPIRLCLRPTASAPCDPALQTTLRTGIADDFFAEPHYLDLARVVKSHGASGRPLLLVATGSIHSVDGDQVRLTQVLAYQRGRDRFVRVFDHLTGKNNNQETRFIQSGPLAGDIAVAEPTDDAPFAFWVGVHAFGPAQTYRQVLRYRSATTYADGNPLAVIDSEMPNILRRLGLWRSGAPLPPPEAPCPKPHLVRTELWCD